MRRLTLFLLVLYALFLHRRRRAYVWCVDLAASRHAWLVLDLEQLALGETVDPDQTEVDDGPTLVHSRNTARITRQVAGAT